MSICIIHHVRSTGPITKNLTITYIALYTSMQTVLSILKRNGVYQGLIQSSGSDPKRKMPKIFIRSLNTKCLTFTVKLLEIYVWLLYKRLIEVSDRLYSNNFATTVDNLLVKINFYYMAILCFIS